MLFLLTVPIKSFEERCDRHIEDLRQVPQPTAADPIGAALVLLNLLKCKADPFA